MLFRSDSDLGGWGDLWMNYSVSLRAGALRGRDQPSSRGAVDHAVCFPGTPEERRRPSPGLLRPDPVSYWLANLLSSMVGEDWLPRFLVSRFNSAVVDVPLCRFFFVSHTHTLCLSLVPSLSLSLCPSFLVSDTNTLFSLCLSLVPSLSLSLCLTLSPSLPL